MEAKKLAFEQAVLAVQMRGETVIILDPSAPTWTVEARPDGRCQVTNADARVAFVTSDRAKGENHRDVLNRKIAEAPAWHDRRA